MDRRLFGTNGIRGVYNGELTVEMAFKVAASIGSFYSGGRMLLARDGRLSSPILSHAVAAGLMDAGCTVYDIGLSTTPMAQYATKALGLDGGVMITASHNPPQYNGIKVMGGNGVEIPREDEIAIEEIYFNSRWRRGSWRNLGVRMEVDGFVEEYVTALEGHVNPEALRDAGLKVVVDPANGVGSLTTPYALRRMGCAVYTVNGNLDGTFPGRDPEPVLENLHGLCAAVTAFKADFGVAHDGDGDRAIFVDEKGVAHWGDRSFALVERYFLARNPGETIVTPVSSGRIVEDVAEEYGGRIVWTKVGSTIVSWKMLELDAKLGGEENGGVFYAPHLPVRDGTMTALLIAEIIAETGRGLSQLMGELPKYYTVKTKIPCPDEAKEAVIGEMASIVKASRLETIDGVKAWFEDGSWILIRPSGTEPIIRIFAEAPTMEKARSLVDEYRDKALSAAKRLGGS
ncbi:MAG: phosphoglucosamine mutase [Candidatus Bathyarchaeia archaeon]|nr:phosphoglucosamine mutase [Candidatus Bathyarchaeota archaeon]